MSGQPGSAEGELIRERREAISPALSRRQAAARAGLSASQWGDVERGHRRAGSGVTIPVQATPDTLARMARVVGATPGDLTTAGRPDAAGRLQAMASDQDMRQRLQAIPGLGTLPADLPTASDGQELLPLIAAGLDAIEHSGLPKATQRDLTTMFTGNLIHDATRRHTELLLILRLATTASHPS